MFERKNLEANIEFYGFSDDVKNQLVGLHSNLESAKGIVDSLLALEIFKTYLICLRDVGVLDVENFERWYQSSHLINPYVLSLK